MHYRKKYSDPTNKKWAARKNGLPVSCLQVIIQTGKIEPEICQQRAVLKMCILTMLPKGNFGVSGISAALLREQYIVCRYRKNIPIFRKFFSRCRKRLQSAVRGVIIRKESGGAAGDDPAAERGASPHEWVTVRPAKAGQVRYAERCTEALPSPEPKRELRQARSVFGRAFFARRYRLMLCLHKA